MEWWREANCVRSPVEFFGEHFTAPALDVCDRCPVTAECLADALTQEAPLNHNLIFGVRGGLVPLARKRLLGKR